MKCSPGRAIRVGKSLIVTNNFFYTFFRSYQVIFKDVPIIFILVNKVSFLKVKIMEFECALCGSHTHFSSKRHLTGELRKLFYTNSNFLMFIFIHLGKERNAARRKKNKNILQPPGPPALLIPIII